jgi:SAM-dependent methyltransferase
MKQFDETTYGERIAGIYDDLYAEYQEATVDLLWELARGGRALELGIGTGRIALPLCQRGVEVTGIDASPAMIARLHAKPGGGEIEVLESSFTEFDLPARFDLVYVVFNTFFGLLTQEDQVRCFQSVARHLADDGLFLLEVFVPDPCRFEADQTIRAVRVEADEVRLDVTQHSPVEQQVTSQHVWLSEEGVRLYPVVLRYAWPSELDLMARLAGLRLRHRWDSWEKGVFSATSTRHISVYGRAE